MSLKPTLEFPDNEIAFDSDFDAYINHEEDTNENQALKKAFELSDFEFFGDGYHFQ